MVKKTELDEPCKHIFEYFTTSNQGIGFNKLRKELEKNDYPMSTPTLSKHLKQHLVKELKLVTFERKGIQGINYRINHKIYERAKKMIRLNEFFEDGKTEFYMKPLEQQINYVLKVMLIKTF